MRIVADGQFIDSTATQGSFKDNLTDGAAAKLAALVIQVIFLTTNGAKVAFISEMVRIFAPMVNASHGQSEVLERKELRLRDVPSGCQG